MNRRPQLGSTERRPKGGGMLRERICSFAGAGIRRWRASRRPLCLPLHCARPSLPTSRHSPLLLPSCYCLTSNGNLGLHPLAAAATWSVVAGHNALNGRCDGRSFSTCWVWSLWASIRVSVEWTLQLSASYGAWEEFRLCKLACDRCSPHGSCHVCDA